MLWNERRTKKWFLIIAFSLIVLGIAMIYLLGFPGLPKTVVQQLSIDGVRHDPAPERNAIAPDFKLLNLKNQDLILSDFRGQPVLINFWATWCAPCRIEMPAIQNRYEEFTEDGLVVLAVNFSEPENDVQAFAEEIGLTFEVLLDPSAEIQKLYRIRGYPTTFFIDSSGVIRVLHIGVMTEGQLDNYLAEIGL